MAGSHWTRMLKEAVVIGIVGLALGIAALALTRFLSGLLFGVGTREPVSFVALPLGLSVVALLLPRALRWRRCAEGPHCTSRSGPSSGPATGGDRGAPPRVGSAPRIVTSRR
jgi:hypothetical protein